MTSTKNARVLLGDKAQDMTDAEVIEIYSQLRSLAEICIEQWVLDQKKKKGVKNER